MVDALRVLERTPRLKIEASRRVTQQFPQYWPGWWLYADMLFHQGPDVGYDWSEALDAFRRVVAMNPKLAPAWKHIVDLATGRDRADASRALARLFELGYPPPGHPEYGTFVRLVDGIDGAGGVVPADLSDLADSVMQFAASSGDEQLALGAADRFLAEGLSRGAARAEPADARVERSAGAGGGGLLGRQRLVLGDSRSVGLGAHRHGSGCGDIPGTTRTEVAPGTELCHGGARRLARHGRSCGGRPAPDRSDCRRRTDEGGHQRHASGAGSRRYQHVGPRGIRSMLRDTRGWVAWLDGLLGFARRDRRAIQAAREEAGRSGYARTDLVDQSLAAFDRALAGDREGAGRQLADMEEACIGDANCPSGIPHIAVQRMMAAALLREAGELDDCSSSACAGRSARG